MPITSIDWSKVQGRIDAHQDGDPGRETYGKLFATVVQRPPNGRPLDTTFLRLGDAAAKFFAMNAVTTVERVAGFIAETAHETQAYTSFEENLSYSADRLAAVWPGRYAVDPRAQVKKPNARALALARKPQMLAIDTYGLRMGNLSAANDTDTSPDGWQYRGRGPTMLTGRDNYRKVGEALNLPLLTNPDLAADPFVGMQIALWFYTRNGVFRQMDIGDTRAERFAVNGGYIGLDEVNRIRVRAVKLLAA